MVRYEKKNNWDDVLMIVDVVHYAWTTRFF